MKTDKMGGAMDRRRFLLASAAAGTGLMAVKPGTVQGAEGPQDAASDTINVALIGAGEQGQRLLRSLIKIPGVRCKAVCDIWADFNLSRVGSYLKRMKQPAATAYTDYQAMLAGEKELDAAIVATPDACHAPQVLACLKAGLHVYCESPMAQTVPDAQAMVKAAADAKKLLQVGFQRRSNPQYLHAYHKLLREVKLFGRITTANGQWNQAVETGRGWPRRAPVEEEVLAKHGYGSMSQFRNWRWYRKFGGGPLTLYGSHQLDVLNWFLGGPPESVMATGGVDYYSEKTHQWPDSVLALLNYRTADGPVRAFYQVVTTNSNLGDYEKLMGHKGALILSESAEQVQAHREESENDWDRWVNLDYLHKPGKKKEGDGEDAEGKAKPAGIDVTETVKPTLYTVPVTLTDPPHKPHLENFFNAVRGQETLRSPGEAGCAAVRVVAAINEAIVTGKQVLLRN